MINTNFLYYWLTVYEHEKQLMKIVSAQKKKKPQKATRKRTNMGSRSNVLKKISESLENELYQHMLYWDNKMKKEFIIKFVHMNNPEWKKADYLELFKELDKLSNKYTKYLLDEKYDHYCKIRCKANLRKLVASEALTFMGVTYKGKSIQLRKYRLNYNVSSVRSDVSKEVKMVRGNYGSLQGITYIKGKLKIENLLNEQSHCLCLSKPYSDSVLYSSSASHPSFEEDKCKLMECSKLLGQEQQGIAELQNVGVLPIDSKESQSMEYVGKFVLEAMESVNLTDMHDEYSVFNQLQLSNNSPDGLQSEGFQGLDVETKNFQQVPCSPQNAEGIFNFQDLIWSDDNSPDKYQLLQQDGDPLWFSRNSDCLSDNLPENDDYLTSSNELQELFSFGNIDSSGAVS